jgi:hypothetical protein
LPARPLTPPAPPRAAPGPPSAETTHALTLPADAAGQRFDVALAAGRNRQRRCYFDTSALAKWYLPEQGSAAQKP